MCDDEDNWSKWVTKVIVGTPAPVLLGVAASTVLFNAGAVIQHRMDTGSWEGAGMVAVNGAVDGFMSGGIGALRGATISTVINQLN